MARPKPVAQDRGRGLGRRKFLTFLVAAPTLTVAAKWGLDGFAPATAVPSLPSLADVGDLGDALIIGIKPTSHLMVLEITEDNRMRFELPRVEVGQGITTSMAMIVAEELDARLGDVDIQLSDSRPELQFNQFTAASTGVRVLWEPVRQMAADARARLVAAAAKRWDVPAGQLTTRDSHVWAPDGRSLSYGSLSADAREESAAGAEPKESSEFKVIGKPTTRLDAYNIVTGKALYTMDLPIEGALPTVVARPPTIKGTVASVDDQEAKAMPGVVAVTRIPSGIAVSAETFYDALRARDALKITWHAGPNDNLSDSDIRSQLKGTVEPLAAPKVRDSYLDVTFDFAFVNHAPMEVENAIAHVRDGKADVWMPSQAPIYAQQTIAEAVGLPEEAVRVHVNRAGGSFGRKLFLDAGLEAARVSRVIGRPVKLMWTRQDDMKHGRMRPRSHHTIRASYTAGEVMSFEHRMAGVVVDFTHGLGEALTSNTDDPNEFPSAIYFNMSQANPYNLGLAQQSMKDLILKIPTGSWRSVYSGVMRTAEEVVMDELAERMGEDAITFRKRMVKANSGKAVLAKAAEAANWGRGMPSGHAQGVGYHSEYRSHVACIVELDASDHPHVTKAVLVADVGQVVNPRGLEAQMLGSTMDGIATALRAGVHIDNGAVRESSYGDFLWTKHHDAKFEFEFHSISTTWEPGGAGELAVPAVCAAVANAYARATGTRPRSFPISF
ncbi:MAG: molybdopterin-dependent oxidoreductase [Actinophytocola sp.]|nr:molybdopterin-dependent oxidoreductase [Actinophytocola sp.]